MNTFEILSITLGFLTLIVLWWQLFLIYKTYKADHERRKKQSTIEYLNEIRKLYRPVEYKLSEKFGVKVIDVDKMSEDDKINVLEFLSIVEHLSTGINVGVFDVELVNRMSGAYFVKMYDKFIPYIRDIRERRHNDNLYCEFSSFNHSLEKMRSSNGVQAKISYS